MKGAISEEQGKGRDSLRSNAGQLGVLEAIPEGQFLGIRFPKEQCEGVTGAIPENQFGR